MGYIQFNFGMNSNITQKTEELEDKVDEKMDKFGLTKSEFFNEILPHVIGFYISCPNNNRETIKKNETTAMHENYLFRLELDSFASQMVNNSTFTLKGDVILREIPNRNHVFVSDIISSDNTQKQSFENYISGSVVYRSSIKIHFDSSASDENLLNWELLPKIPIMNHNIGSKNFISVWRKFLDFEKAITLENIKSYPIDKKISYLSVCEVIKNESNREKFEDDIVKESGSYFYIDINSQHLIGDEMKYLLVSMSVDANHFGNNEKEIKNGAVKFARLEPLIIGETDREKLNRLINDLKSNNNKPSKEYDLKGFDFYNWLFPDYDQKSRKINFSFLKDIEDVSDIQKIKNEISNFGDKLYLANIASGDIALYKRGKFTLDKLERGNVKNSYLSAILSEPKTFDTGTENFNINNVKFGLDDLNSSQKEAIIKCLNSSNIFCLQGPPGTGKTQTITELVYQYNKMGKKVLLSSQTHIAIDNVIKRLPKELNILPIRLVRNRKKAEKQFLPDMVLDNFYDTAYYKYQGKLDDYEKYEKNIQLLTRVYENNLSLYEKIRRRLDNVKKLEEERNELIKNHSRLRADENEKNAEFEILNRVCSIFTAFYSNGLPFEAISDNCFYAPLLESFSALIKKHPVYPRILESDDIYDYAVAFRRIAGKKRVDYLKSLLSGGDIPKDLEEIDKQINDLQKELDTFKKYGNNPPQELLSRINTARQKKKEIDRRNEISDIKTLNTSNETFYFKSSHNKYGKAAVEAEITAINDFVNEYNDILKQIFKRNEYDGLTKKRILLEGDLEKIRDKIKRVSVACENRKQEISGINAPIKEDRGKLAEYFNEFYTGNLNGVSLPVTDEEKFNEIKGYIDQEKRKFDSFKANFTKLHDIYSSVVNYLKDRDNFVREQRDKYTNDLLKKIVNVYGITCTSGQRFLPSDLVGADNEKSGMTVDNLYVDKIDFDVVIIDEVSKATPIELLIPIICAKNIILVGDQRQLPPIFKYHKSLFEGKTEETKKDILQDETLDYYKRMVETSLFEEIYNKLNRNKAMLTQQYRFNEAIMKCVNVFYNGKLTLGGGEDQNNKKKHYLDISINNGSTPVFCRKNSTYWFDSHSWQDGSTAYSEVQEGETSYRNQLEVKLTVKMLSLLEEGYGELKKNNPEEYKMAATDGKKPSVAIITMYGKQLNSIKNELKTKGMLFKSLKNISVECDTVDNYQGNERDIVIVNMVANTKNDNPGEFLTKFNRINVAISRARAMLVMIGSSKYFNRVKVNVPDMETGKENYINAYYKIFEQCESKWVAAASIFGINKETIKGGAKNAKAG